MPMSQRLLRPRATGFNPRSISGLLAWYDAADASSVTLNGSNISQIADKSGNGRNATQSTAASQPAYVSNVRNGLSVCRFNGSTRNDDLSLSVPLSSSVTVFWAGTPSSKSDSYIMAGSAAGGRPAIISNYAPTSRAYEYFGSGADRFTIATSAAGFSVVAYTINSLALVGYVNGSQTVSPNLVNAITGSNMSRFGSASGAAYAQADMAEVLIYDRALSADERRRVERYLGRKWAITVA